MTNPYLLVLVEKNHNYFCNMYSFNEQAAPTHYYLGHLIFPRLEFGIWKCQNSKIKYGREIIWKKAKKTKINSFTFSCIRFYLYFPSY